MNRAERRIKQSLRRRAQGKYNIALAAHDEQSLELTKKLERQLRKPEVVAAKGLPQGLTKEAVAALAQAMSIEKMRAARPHIKNYVSGSFS